ncbi:hypothetical protein TNCV_3050371 [Trichonephila clavipes]|nr:hypothetical protein TNCV_3050371 [Trichonephila clavipes]
MLIPPDSSHPGLVRGTIVLLGNAITVQITEQHKRMKVVTHQLYVPNCIQRGWYMHRRSQAVPEKIP